MCASEKESFSVQLKALSDKLVNQVGACWMHWMHFSARYMHL
jgi:hypothetical protein